MASSSTEKTTATPQPAVNPLPDPHRHITANDAEAKSVFSQDLGPSSLLPVTNDLGGALFRLAYTLPRAPGRLDDGADMATYRRALADPPHLVTPGGGANVWYVDTPPGGTSPMHRTVSLDLVVMLVGELELELDSGERRTVRAGDVVVQRSTVHIWTNHSHTQWSRMLAVMSEIEPVRVGDQVLEEYFEGR